VETHGTSILRWGLEISSEYCYCYLMNEPDPKTLANKE